MLHFVSGLLQSFAGALEVTSSIAMNVAENNVRDAAASKSDLLSSLVAGLSRGLVAAGLGLLHTKGCLHEALQRDSCAPPSHKA